ncbi:hypothetical protein F4860DRAFT_141598 [Xylaria cubensis]|nr:hypothetical protein F4860DRAFT_141598 [Xylaria cubensis]
MFPHTITRLGCGGEIAAAQHFEIAYAGDAATQCNTQNTEQTCNAGTLERARTGVSVVQTSWYPRSMATPKYYVHRSKVNEARLFWRAVYREESEPRTQPRTARRTYPGSARARDLCAERQVVIIINLRAYHGGRPSFHQCHVLCIMLYTAAMPEIQKAGMLLTKKKKKKEFEMSAQISPVCSVCFNPLGTPVAWPSAINTTPPSELYDMMLTLRAAVVVGERTGRQALDTTVRAPQQPLSRRSDQRRIACQCFSNYTSPPNPAQGLVLVIESVPSIYHYTSQDMVYSILKDQAKMPRLYEIGNHLQSGMFVHSIIVLPLPRSRQAFVTSAERMLRNIHCVILSWIVF